MAERQRSSRGNSRSNSSSAGRGSARSSSRPSSGRTSSSRSSESSSRSSSSRPSSRSSSRTNARSNARSNARPNSTDRPRSERPRSDRPRRDDSEQERREFKPRTERSDRPRRDGDRPSRGPRNSSAFRPRNERFGDRSLENRRKDDRRPVNRDFSRDPIIPDGITGEELEKSTRGDLLTLSAENAKVVAQHLSAVNLYADTDPVLAHEHAQAAVRHAGRVAVVRETAGYAAYRIGKYELAIKELKAAYRINGDVSIWPVLADCERGLGRPRKALELAGDPIAKKLGKAESVELRIVAAGARRDLGEVEAAIVTLQSNDLNTENDSWAIRLRYAYADALEAAGRHADAKKWFKKCAQLDVDETTDAKERC